jgi:hypothetical protein
MNFIKNETPVYPDVLTNPVLQVLSDEEWVSRLLMVNVCSAPIKHLTPLFDSVITPSTYTSIS